jgi:arginase family enzyme
MTRAGLPECGLLETLRARRVRVADHGDLAVTRWTAERADERPNAWRQVVDLVAAARSAISEVVRAGQTPLVLGGVHAGRMSFDHVLASRSRHNGGSYGKPVGNNAVFAAKLILVHVDGRRTSCWAYLRLS